MEGNDDVLISHCIGRTWHPPPPACVSVSLVDCPKKAQQDCIFINIALQFQAALPIALECPVDQNGIKGTITMWQMSNSTPTLIHGYVSTAGVDKERTVLLETFELSRNACIATTENITSAMPDAMPLGENQLEVRFNSTRLLAFKKAQIRLAMIFIDVPKNLTATVVTVHQGKAALVMRLPLPLPSASAGWSFDDAEENCGGNQREPIQAVEDGNGVRTKDEEFPASEDDAEEIATHMEDETVLPESRETKLEQESNYNTGNYPGQDYRTY